MNQSSFNLKEQNQRVESRIVVALERISEAFRVLLWNESREHALSPIQIQLLIFIQFHPGEKCKVSYLANEFNMTKATVSDSIKVLIAKELVTKEIYPVDARSFSLILTSKGKKITNDASLFANTIEQPINKLSEEQKSTMLNGLLQLIFDLNQSGIIHTQRMCYTCTNYSNNSGEHFCKLLESKLAQNELRLDCPEHVLKS